MAYKIEIINSCLKSVDRLSKKYKSFPGDLLHLVEILEVNPHTGTPIGEHCYKIRLAIKSKGQGKSGGARVITYALIRNEGDTVYILSVYDKSEKSTITKAELKELISQI